MTLRKTFFLTLVLASFAGCGGSTAEPALEVFPCTGVVTLNGEPLAEATVSAVPNGTTQGSGGVARSNERGEFKLTHIRGEDGLPPGEYKLTVSLRKNPDGTVPPANDPTPPIESKAVETLPPEYSDLQSTTLTHTVTRDAKPLELKLQAKK